MSEICLSCLNKDCGTNLKRRHVVLDWDICESCAEWKKCVIVLRPRGKKIFFKKK